MKDINPTKRLIRGNNVFNLAIIDNINFKELTLPILTNETPEPVRELNVDTQLFGMTSGMHTMQAKIDQTFEKFYGIFHLATAIGVRFLDKLQAVVDYRSIKRDITAGPINENICIRVWYFYYEYFAMWKSHLIGICIGNYKLQQDSLTAFALLFPAAGKNNYITSVAHFLSILKKFPKLEEKLQYCTSINLARKGHYPAFDEALEMRGVGYIKQNIIGKVVDQENLTLQIQATQEERKRIDTLLNEFLDPYNYDRNDQNPAPKRQRKITTDEEKEILSSLLLKDTMPTETEINNVLINLPAEWDSQRVKHYYNNNKMSKKKK
ncbi:hypothetical protein RhiirA1_476363 [Rhizophagus irregularis]|uniref:Uncharacterized protein n=1 Tax=Rhizophagus irregularis TaxID=588596 RepID=A0A2I1FIE8_9GLOM|nr:hypothetical protein RhiirA1_476363 [Rhizophagus irregularis]PKY34152.1 hypothetical protein RhiirB3_453595 [Rhizophagus irregularis]